MTNRLLKIFRRKAFTQQFGRCFYCKLPMWEEDSERFAEEHGLRLGLSKHLKCTAEHVQARQDGGTICVNNIVAACAWCNTRRHLGRHLKAPSSECYQSAVRHLMGTGKWHPVLASITANRHALVSPFPERALFARPSVSRNFRRSKSELPRHFS